MPDIRGKCEDCSPASAPLPEWLPRTPDVHARALRNIYDELFELNVTRNLYRIAYHTPHKYLAPPLEGRLDDMLRTAAEQTVHPEDRERFQRFFAVERLLAGFDAGADSLVLEYRKLLQNGLFVWVQATVLPMRDTADDILICYVLDIEQRKRMEEKNAMLQEICNAAVENEYEFVCLIRVPTRQYVIYAFGAAVDALPESGDYDALLETLAASVLPEDRAAWRDGLRLEHVRAMLERGHDRHTVVFRSLAGGAPRWMNTRLSYFRNNPDILLSTTRDVHETYTAKEKERAVAEQFLQSFGSMYADIVELDPIKGRAVIIKSARHPERKGQSLPCGVFLSRYAGERLYEEDRPIFEKGVSPERLRELLESGKKQKSTELRCLVDGAPYEWMELSLFVIEDVSDARKKLLFTARNVNEQKLLKSIVDHFVYNNSDYFIYLDVRRDSYLMFSGSDSGTPLPPAASSDYTGEMIRYARTYVAPEDQDRVIEDMRLDKMLEVLDRDGQYILYCGVREPGGYRRKRLEYVYYDKRNKMVLLTRTDVTHMYNEEQRKNALLRAALEEAETANRAKTDFLSRMSHDIRTPLNAITGMTAIALSRLHDRIRVGDCLEKIRASSQYLLLLINDVLDMSRIESGMMALSESVFSFPEFLRGLAAIIRPQAENGGIVFSLVATDPLAGRYVGDALRLNQILMNLLSNALRYTPSGGSVRLEIREARREGNRACLEFVVADTGCGMSEAFMARMYHPFEQEHPGVARNRSGTGLGLAIVRNLVLLMGGEIRVRSVVAEGTVFTVTLYLGLAEDDSGVPAVAEASGVQRAQEGAPGACPRFGGQRVLLVEDNEINREIAATLLEDADLRVDAAVDGGRAVEMFRRAPAGAYAAVLMDIRMPVMNGLEATRAIRALDRPDAGTVPIIGMSANAFQEEVREALEAGMSAYLVKPLDIGLLYRKLEELL